MAFNLTIADPLGFLATLKRDTKIFSWVSLLFQMALSSVVTFCGITGGILVVGGTSAKAIGAGLSSVAVVLAVFFGSSPLTRGMMLVRPEQLAQEEIDSNVAITRRN